MQEKRGKGLIYIILGAIILLMASLFFVPFLSPTLTLILAILMFTGSSGFKSQFLSNWKYILLFSSVFWAYLFGLIHTDNMDSGIMDAILKLSFLIYPFIFGIAGKKIISKKDFHFLLQSFVAIALMSTLFCLGEAVFQYLINGESSEFFYTKLSYFMHSSYYALYLNFALIIILYQLLDNHSTLHKSILISYKILIPYLIVFLILLESKAGLLGLFSIMAFVALYIFIYQKRLKKALIFMGLGIAFIAIVFTIVPSSSKRIDAVIESVEEKGDAADHSVSAARIYLWKAALEAIKLKPIMGHGTGDVKEVLITQYDLQNNQRAIDHNYNSHNQILQSAVALGVFGLITMLLIIIFPIYKGFKEKNLLYFLFGFLMLINVLVESMFERQAGVMFFAFFNSFIYFESIQKDEA